jgi:hypothetical protein
MDADSRTDLPVPPNASNCSSDAPLTSCKGASLHLPWLWSYSDEILCWEATPLFRQILNQAPRRTCIIPTYVLSGGGDSRGFWNNLPETSSLAGRH